MLEPEQNPRIVAPLNRDWWYSGPVSPDAPWPQPADLTGFERVTLPHANVILPWHGFDESAFQLLSEYRRTLTVPESLRGQRVFLDFDGVMTAHTVSLNGTLLGEYLGGYLPSSFELTNHLRWGRPNEIAVRVDSTERTDIPPFGGRIDYLTFGGIYREARLRIVPQTYIANVFVKPVDVLTDRRRVIVRVDLDSNTVPDDSLRLGVDLYDSQGIRIGSDNLDIELTPSTPRTFELTVERLAPIELWDLDRPTLYRAIITLAQSNGDQSEVLDRFEVRFGFREARFTPEGFFLNGRRVKLRGLNRHQTYPYVGGAMPAEVEPDRGELGYLPRPPFITDALQASWGQRLRDLTIEGYLGDRLVVTQTYPARSTDAILHVEPDDPALLADGSDATRVVLRVTDAEGHRRPFATGAITLALSGPAELIGENPFALAGGVGAVWVKATEQPGEITLTATHPYLGSRTVVLTSTAVPPEPF